MALTSRQAAAQNRRYLATLEPDVRVKAEAFLRRSQANGFDLVLVQGERTEDQQNKLFAQGRTAPGNRVTNAAGAVSPHVRKQAFDVAFRDPTSGRISQSNEDPWDEIGRIGQESGLRWGGDFGDRPHFEARNAAAENIPSTVRDVSKDLPRVLQAARTETPIAASEEPKLDDLPFVSDTTLSNPKDRLAAGFSGPRDPSIDTTSTPETISSELPRDLEEDIDDPVQAKLDELNAFDPGVPTAAPPSSFSQSSDAVFAAEPVAAPEASEEIDPIQAKLNELNGFNQEQAGDTDKIQAKLDELQGITTDASAVSTVDKPKTSKLFQYFMQHQNIGGIGGINPIVAAIPFEKGVERALRSGGRQAVKFAEARLFGTPKLIGSSAFADYLVKPEDQTRQEHIVEESLGLYAGIKSIGDLVKGVGGLFGRATSLTKGFGMSKTFERLATGYSTGKFAPRLSHAVLLGLGSGAASTLDQLSGILSFSKETRDAQSNFDPLSVAISTAHGFALGAALVPSAKGTFSGIPGLRKLSGGPFKGVLQGKQSFNRISLGVRGAALGLPLVALSGGESSSPWQPTGNPYIDQLLFDYGLFAVMGGGKPRVGMPMPAYVTRGGVKTVEPVTLRKTYVDKTGRRNFAVMTEDGLLRDYRPGDPAGAVNADIVSDIKVTIGRNVKTNRPQLIQEGDIVVGKYEGKEKLLQFLGRTKDGKFMRVGVIHNKGEAPATHEIIEVAKGSELLVLDRAGRDAMYARLNVEVPPNPESSINKTPIAGDPNIRSSAGAPGSTKEGVETLSVNGMFIPVEHASTTSPIIETAPGITAIRARRTQLITDALSVLPLEALVNVKKVEISRSLGTRTFADFNLKTGVIRINAGRVDRASKKINGIQIPGMDMLIRTLAHEGQHANAARNPKGYEQDIRALGWKRMEEFKKENDTVSEINSPLELENLPGNIYDSRRQIYHTRNGEIVEGISSFDIGPLGGRWVRQILPEELRGQQILHDRRSPVEDLAHGFDQMLLDPDAFFVRDPSRWKAINDSITATPYTIAGLTVDRTEQFGTGFAAQLPLFGDNGPRQSPAGDRLEAAVKRVKLEQDPIERAQRNEIHNSRIFKEKLAAENTRALRVIAEFEKADKTRNPRDEEEIKMPERTDQVMTERFEIEASTSISEATVKKLAKLQAVGKGGKDAIVEPFIESLINKAAERFTKGVDLNAGSGAEDGLNVRSWIAERVLWDVAHGKSSGDGTIMRHLMSIVKTGAGQLEGQSVEIRDNENRLVNLIDGTIDPGEGKRGATGAGVVEAPIIDAKHDVGAERANRKPRSKPWKLFKQFVGSPDPVKHAAFVEEMASLPDLHRKIVMMHLMIKPNGEPLPIDVSKPGAATKHFPSLEEVGARFNLSPTEAGSLFRGYIRRATGRLEKVFGDPKGNAFKQIETQGGKQLMLRTLPQGSVGLEGKLVTTQAQTDLIGSNLFGPGNRGFVDQTPGESFMRHFNNSRKKTLESLTDERSRIGQALHKAPKNKVLQKRWRDNLVRINEMERAIRDSEAIDPSPDPIGTEAQDELFQNLIGSDRPAPTTVNKGARGWSKENLINRWKKARLFQLKSPESENNNKNVAEYSAEMNRRSIEFPKVSYPKRGGGAGGGDKPPKQGDPRAPGGGKKPDKGPPGDFYYEVLPDTSLAGQTLANLHGDLRPRTVTIHDKVTGDVVGTFKSHSAHPDYDAVRLNTRYGIEINPVGITNAALEPTTPDKGEVRFLVTDLKDGSDLGYFTRDGVLQILNHNYRDGVNYNATSGEAINSGSTVAKETSGELRSRMWREEIEDAEFRSLEGPEQFKHLAETLLGMDKSSGEKAWRRFANVFTSTKQYPGSIPDYAILQGKMVDKFGRPDALKVVGGDVLGAMTRIRKLHESDMGKMLSELSDFYPTQAGGTGKAYSAERLAEVRGLKDILKNLFETDVSYLTDAAVNPETGQIEWFGHPLGATASVVRRMVFFSHPLMADAYTKARGVQANELGLIDGWLKALNPIFDGLTNVERITTGLLREGMYEDAMANPIRTATRRALLDDTGRFAETRKLLDSMSTVLRGGTPATTDLLLPTREDNPTRFAELERRSKMLGDLTDSIADMLGLPPGARLEKYLPHIYEENRGGFLNIPTEQNPGRDVYFRHLQKREFKAGDYEVDPLQTMDLYIKGAARKISWDPFLAEFNRPEIMKYLGREQAQYFLDWMRFAVGEPDPSDTKMLKIMQGLGINGQDNMLRPLARWMRMAALGSDRPFTKLANGIRGMMFASRIEMSLITTGVNATQSPLTTSMRFGSAKFAGMDGYLKALKAATSDARIKELFAGSAMADQAQRSDLGIQAQRHIRGFLGNLRNIGRRSFTAIEAQNRANSFAIMFKTAREAGLSESDSVVAAILETDLTQFNMTRTGRLPLVRKGFMSVAFQFTPYRWEMLQLLGGEVRNMYNAPAAEPGVPMGERPRFKAFKRIALLAAASHVMGGLDAHVGPFLRYIFDEDDVEFQTVLAYIDMLSFDYLLGKATIGKPFQLGHYLNPISLVMQPEISGPFVGAAGDVINKLRGSPMSPTWATLALENTPWGVQLHKTFGREIETYITKPLFGRTEGKLPRAGRTLHERLTGRPPKHSRFRQVLSLG